MKEKKMSALERLTAMELAQGKEKMYRVADAALGQMANAICSNIVDMGTRLEHFAVWEYRDGVESWLREKQRKSSVGYFGYLRKIGAIEDKHIVDGVVVGVNWSKVPEKARGNVQDFLALRYKVGKPTRDKIAKNKTTDIVVSVKENEQIVTEEPKAEVLAVREPIKGIPFNEEYAQWRQVLEKKGYTIGEIDKMESCFDLWASGLLALEQLPAPKRGRRSAKRVVEMVKDQVNLAATVAICAMPAILREILAPQGFEQRERRRQLALAICLGVVPAATWVAGLLVPDGYRYVSELLVATTSSVGASAE